MDTILGIASKFFVDPFELWVENAEILSNAHVHTELEAGLTLNLPNSSELLRGNSNADAPRRPHTSNGIDHKSQHLVRS